MVSSVKVSGCVCYKHSLFIIRSILRLLASFLCGIILSWTFYYIFGFLQDCTRSKFQELIFKRIIFKKKTSRYKDKERKNEATNKKHKIQKTRKRKIKKELKERRKGGGYWQKCTKSCIICFIHHGCLAVHPRVWSSDTISHTVVVLASLFISLLYNDSRSTCFIAINFEIYFTVVQYMKFCHFFIFLLSFLLFFFFPPLLPLLWTSLFLVLFFLVSRVADPGVRDFQAVNHG